MNRRPCLLLVLIFLVAGAGSAQAGAFGGFTPEGKYKTGNRLCTLITKPDAVPACESPSPKQMAALRLTKGIKQTGATQKVLGARRSSKIEITDAKDGSSLFVWDSGQVLGAIGDLYLHPNGQWLAVEYQTRFGGRQVDAVLGLKLTSSVSPPSGVHPRPTTPASVSPSKVSESFAKFMNSGRRWAKRRKFKKAADAFGKALAEQAEHPEALYRLAVAQMGLKDKAAALSSLEHVKKSEHSERVRWRVEARFDLAFKSLRADSRFRKAVGIEREPGDAVSLYERLVAFGGRWEQERIPCEQPQVNLDLRRDKKLRFDLVIRSKCQGSSETTRLDGSWAARGDTRLGLTFPNTDAADDDLTCAIELCSDDSGEDCLRCQVDQDMEFLLRVVRR